MSHTEAYTDVVELCALLQCLGFSVKSLDSGEENLSQDGGSKTVVINCPTSGLHVVLESANVSCTCPAQSEQNSGMWQVSGMAGGKQLDKEFGCTLLGSLPRSHRERLSKDLREMIRCIKDNNESADVEKLAKEDNKSASMTELKTPEKLLFAIKAETPTRYRSLDTLTARKEVDQRSIPTPGLLQRARLISDCDNEADKKKMCSRQSTYTLSSTPGSVRRRNKTSSPIKAPPSNLLESLMDAERAAVDLRNKLALVIREYAMEDEKNDSSMSSLTLDVSKISVIKPVETSKTQFASSPNLAGLSAHSDINKRQLNRYESVSTSNLAKPSPKEGKLSKLKRISPNIFKKKETPTLKVDKAKSQDGKSKLNSLFKPKIVTPVRIPIPEPSPNLSSSSRKKYSHIKSTIPRPAKKE